MSLPTPHPAFAAHFTDPLYDDVALESAPFGSDEGSDVLWEWGERRDELAPGSTIAEVMEMDEGDVAETVARMAGIDHLDQAAIVRGAAFTLLRLVGHLGEEDRQTVLRVLDYEIATTADPGWLPQEARDQLVPPLERQRGDLLAWRNPAQ
ncbi:hypothetical protein GGQ22_09010 [Nocardioides sp. zg-579]|uniref:Uncharacterized protein n=1 Tax=Nocardioides marmotae TaxID=2663857 RepID=A0A6I3JAT7_9ACTN|nr:hypothetical protein [Nocardioides marmotae]MCR6031585.1 hypothetical protein [Gordonia jinghuaiqii]MTB95224.1 hypothetical protein [Nocardioides marmotae]QKE02300.1 hypothetical protein HPC71_15385 [Nocardioides marmotae]